MDEYTKNIGSNIRLKRKQKGMTIDELAEEVGMSPGYLGLLERGQRGTSMSNLVKISDLFGITMEQLIRYDLSTGEKKGEIKMTKERQNFKKMVEEMPDAMVSLMAGYAKLLNMYDIY